MSPKIEISIGELFDKVTILEIKKEKGLPVDKELDMLTQDISEFKSPLTDRLYDLLKSSSILFAFSNSSFFSNACKLVFWSDTQHEI